MYINELVGTHIVFLVPYVVHIFDVEHCEPMEWETDSQRNILCMLIAYNIILFRKRFQLDIESNI